MSIKYIPRPARYAVREFPDGREVAGAFKNGSYFWRFRSDSGEKTRLRFSEEGMDAMIAVYMRLLKDQIV